MNALCEFKSLSPDLIACTRCGRQVPTSQAPARVKAACRSAAPRQPPRRPCLHLGDETRRQTCRTCAGHVELKIFNCQKLGAECSVAKPLEGVAHCCATCPAHEPREEAGVIRLKSKIQNPKSKIRIGLLSPCFCTGGVERWWLSLCRHWATSSDLAIAGIALTDGAESDQPTIDEALRFGPVFASRRLDRGGRNALKGVTRHASGYAAVAALLEFSDVIITWGHEDAERYLAGFGGQVIAVSHGCAAWTSKMMAGASRCATRLAAVAEPARDTFPAALRESVTIIPNGIDFDRCTPSREREEIRREWGLKDGWRAVGFVGRFSPEKNPLAAARAVRALPSSIAVYAGATFDRATFQADVRAMTPQCRFVIPDHLGDVYRGLDCLVSASHEEACALVVLEAWAAGLPVVSTPVGAVAETERRFGPLAEHVPINATGAQLAAAVERATSPDYRPTLERARAIVWEHFSAARMARDWARLLRNAAGGE
jgi:glycosyltransferase involved in cell wall biosynthesis